MKSTMIPTKPMVWKPEDGLSQSMIGRYLTCHRLFVLGLYGYRTPSGAAAKWGSVWHAALDIYYNSSLRKQKRMVWEDLVDKACLMEDIHDVNRIEIAIVLEEYFKHYQKDRHIIVKSEIEFDYHRQFKGISEPIRLRGKIDGVTSKGWLVERKTKGRFPTLQALEYDLQLTFYRMALEATTKQRPKGVLYDIARRPSIRNKDSNDFATRLKNAIMNDRASYFQRNEFIWDEEIDYQRELEKLIALIYVSARHLQRISTQDKDQKRVFDIAFRNPLQCTALWTCDFIDYCSGYADINEMEQQALFQELSGK